MANLTLVIMAAGIGSRYGGLKQMEPVGPGGELLIDFSIYDALQAGFDSVVFVIRKDIEHDFRTRVGRNVEARVETAYVFQSLDQLPEGFGLPAARQKPWGTGQALLLCQPYVKTPFLCINADDFYGRLTYKILAEFLRQARDESDCYIYAMAGYELTRTVSEYGHVTRAVCEVSPSGYLQNIKEIFCIQKFPDGIKCLKNDNAWHLLEPGTIVSMNFWGFTASIFGELETRFPLFLQNNLARIDKAEYLLPEVVGELVREKRARVKVLPTPENWVGITYPEDRPKAQVAILELIKKGLYPEKIWA